MTANFRLMLVGHDWGKCNKVGNTLLDKWVFETEDQSGLIKNHSTAISKYVHNKYITVASMADLFASDLAEETLRQRVKQCVSLCHPGPQALVLVVDPSDFREQQRRRMEQIMDFFSEQACKHAIVFIIAGSMTPEDMAEDIRSKKNKEIETIMQRCGGKHHMYSGNQAEALQAVEEMVSKNGYSLLTYVGFEDADPSSRSSLGAVSTEKLVLVLCGSDASLKSKIAELILSLEEQTGHSQQSGDSSACVKREGHVCGHHVTLIQLPSLEKTQASDEDLWQEAMQCLHLSDPGVDAFLIIRPTAEGQRTDEDKSVLRRIEHFFGEEVCAFCLAVLMRPFEQLSETRHGDTVSQQGAGTSEGPDFIVDHISKVKPLLERVIKMRQDNRGCYTLGMYSASLLKFHLRCHSQFEEKVSSLQRENRDLKSSKQDCLSRIRSGLIKRMSRPLLGSLLAELQAHSPPVVSVWEAEEILQRSSVVRDQVTSLVDVLLRKGEKACGIMFSLLKELDRDLYGDLSL